MSSKTETPRGTAPQRAVAYVQFTEPVEIPGMDFVRELTAGTEVPKGRYPGNPMVKPPVMWRDSDSQELVIGEDRIPLAGGLVKRYRLAKAAVG